MYLFQASGYRQLRYMKGYGIWLFGVKGFGFVMHSYLKEGAFTAVKRNVKN